MLYQERMWDKKIGQIWFSARISCKLVNFIHEATNMNELGKGVTRKTDFVINWTQLFVLLTIFFRIAFAYFIDESYPTYNAVYCDSRTF